MNSRSDYVPLVGNSVWGSMIFCRIGLLYRLNYRLWRKTTICVCVTFKCQSKATWVCVAERPASSQRTEESGTVDLFVDNKQTQLWHHEHLFVSLWAWNSSFAYFKLVDNWHSLKFSFFRSSGHELLIWSTKKNHAKLSFEGKAQNLLLRKV